MSVDPRRIAPVAVAGVLAFVYVVVSPPSLDLATHLLRAKLFTVQGFGIWNNWWYGGHHTPSYSVLFPPAAAALTPQLAAAIAATATAALFAPLAHDRFGPDSWLGATWFGAATATNLFTGRLAFAFGLLPAVAAMLALERRRPVPACGLAALSALCSPVAALFAAIGGAAYAIGAWIGARQDREDQHPPAPTPADPPVHPPAAARARAQPPNPLAGIALAAAALIPVAALAIAFPEGGTEPFTFATLWPIPVVGVAALLALPRDAWTLRAGVALYVAGCLVAFAIATPVGSNVARLGALVAGPLAALLWWRRRPALLLAVAVPLIYLQWQAPVRDVRTATGDPSASAAYYQPLLDFLGRQSGPPFRVEIPFTQFHWEAYVVAPRFPIARGWERQLDIQDNHLFYGGALNPQTYHAWLRSLAVRFVAVPDARLDYSAHRETRLIDRGLPYLRLARRMRHWAVYEVIDATPIVQGAATLRSIGSDSLTISVLRPGTALVHVRFTPYWKLGDGFGCVMPAGDFTHLTLRHAGVTRLAAAFSLGRVGARSPRCS
jgi:hypothetical protein